MTDSVPDSAERALDRHAAFEPIDDQDTYAVTTTPFDAQVRAEPAEPEGRDAAFDVQVDLPRLDAVASEPVADVVEDGWFDALELHLADAPDVAEVDPAAETTVMRDGDVVHVRVRFWAWSAGAGVDDAKAVVDYVEGTYVQAVIPGYEYREPVAGLLARGTQTADGESGGAERGGTPL